MAGTDATAGRFGAVADRARRLAVTEPLAAVFGALVVVLAGDLVAGLATGRYAFSTVGSNLWSGLLRGLVVGLAGIGLSMTYSILGFANFAHGDYITVGGFAGAGATYLVAGVGTAGVAPLVLLGVGGDVTAAGLGVGILSTPLAVVVGFVVAAVAGAGLALGLDRVVYRPLRDADGISLLITSIGVAFALRYLIVFVYNGQTRNTVSSAGNPRARLNLIDGIVTVKAHDVLLLVVAVGLMVGVHLLLRRTKLGKAMRAMADNEDLARVTGIPTERVVRATWLVGGGLTGVAGFALTMWTETLAFNDGWLLLLLVFAAVILGGIGSIYGAIAGGLIIGLTASMSVVWLPSGLDRAAAFAVMILILLFRPEGIFAGRSTA